MNDIAEFCKTQNPALIYLAIGPANAPLQQYPPFLANYPKPQLCILFDPRLEEELTHEKPDGVTFVYLRRNFDWEHETAFIDDLCQIPSAKVIAQDYSGADIRKYYPLSRLGPSILKKVLFDVTYSDGNCGFDFSTVQIFHTDDGGFVNPLQVPLADSIHYITNELASTIAKERNIAIQFVFALYSIQAGREEPRQWCTPTNIMWRAGWFFQIHGLAPLAIEELLVAHFLDLVAVVSEPNATREYALRLMESKEYIAMTGILASMI
jgi:hypothetical protein